MEAEDIFRISMAVDHGIPETCLFGNSGDPFHWYNRDVVRLREYYVVKKQEDNERDELNIVLAQNRRR